MGIADVTVNTRPTISQIIGATAQYFQISTELLLSPSKLRKYARPRQIAMYLSYELTAHSYPSVARHFYKRDHTTVIHAYQSIGRLTETNETTRTAVDGIRNIVANRTKGPNLDAPAFEVASEVEPKPGDDANRTLE